jgi:hypothetical protein
MALAVGSDVNDMMAFKALNALLYETSVPLTLTGRTTAIQLPDLSGILLIWALISPCNLIDSRCANT